MALRSIVCHQIHRQATLQPRMALPAGRTVSLEEGYRLAKLFHEEEARVEQEEVFTKQGDNPVCLDEEVSRKIVLLRQQHHKEANIKANIAYARRQKQQFRHAVSSNDTEKVLELAQKLHRKPSGSIAKVHEKHQTSAQKNHRKSSKKG